jgi:hypothetical protein
MLWQWATAPGWAKIGLGLILLAVVLQMLDLLVSSWRGVVLAAVVLAAVFVFCGCERAAFDAQGRDAAAVDVGPVVDSRIIDAEPLSVCGPSPITIDRDCGGFTDSGATCMVASGIAKAPCLFQGGYLVADCSQCWWLP